MRKQTLPIIILIFCSIFFDSYAQNPVLDSLENLLQQHIQKDTTRVNLLNKVCDNLYRVDIDKTFIYAKEAEALADSLSFRKGKAENLRLIGVYYEKKSDYPKALEYVQTGLKIFEELGYKKGISTCFNNIGIIYWYQGDYHKALDAYQKSLRISEQLGDKKGISNCLNNIGLIYSYQRNYPEALEYYKRSLKIYEETGNTSGLSHSYNNIGIVFGSQGDYPKALEYFLKSLEIRKELGDKRGIAFGYYNIGDNYLLQGDYSKALEYVQKSLEINVEIGNKSLEALGYVGLGNLYLKLNQAQKAYNYSKKAYLMGEEIKENDLIKKSAAILAKSSEALGRYRDAYTYHVVFKAMNDSLYNEENVKKITGLEFQYNFEKEKQAIELEQQKKDAVQAEEMRRQKVVRNAFISGFMLVLLLAVVILRSFIQKRKANQILAEQKEEIETQAEELKTTNEKLVELDGFKEAMTGMVVHDFKNSLNTIINFSEDVAGNSKMRSIRQAGKNMYRLVMNLLDVQKFEDTSVPLSLQDQNIKVVTMKAVDQVRFLMEQKNLKITTELEGGLTGRFDMELITRVMENLLTNAIKFSPANGSLLVATHAENQHIKISISDHGPGISKENLVRVFNKFEQIESKESGVTRSTGLGLTFCKMVVEAHHGTIGVDSEMDKGSTFWFTIPRSDDQEPDLKIAAEIDSPVVDKLSLTEEDQSFLRPFQQELNHMNIYEYSRIISVLSQIEKGKRPNIDMWIERFEIVLRNMDEQNFKEMLDF